MMDNHLLEQLDSNFYNQIKENWIRIVNLMEHHKVIGVFPKNENSLKNHIFEWAITMFHFIEEKNCTLFVPYLFDESNNHYDAYNAIIIFDLKTSQEKNDIFHKKDKILINDKNIDVLYITYSLKCNENDPQIYHYIYI